MATQNVRRTNSQPKDKGAEQAPAANTAKARSARAAQDGGVDVKASRAKVLQSRFCPEGVKYLKDVLGIDLNSRDVSLEDLYNIAEGRVTNPLEAVVTPLVYDTASKKVVESKPIKVISSFRIVMPYDRKTFKPIAPSAENRPFVASYPCFEYLQKAEPAQKVAPQKAAAGSDEALPVFTEAQMQALEGIGIARERLYSGSFNALTVDEKRDILAGKVFDANGIVRIADGTGESRLSISVNGRARMNTHKDGSVTMSYESQYPVAMKANDIVDIRKVRRIGNLEIDFFERDTRGKVKTDVYDNPVLNKAGKDLCRYGYCFGGVDGIIHERAFNKESRQWEDTTRKEKYQVSLVNGGLCVTRMQRVPDLDKDGEQLKTIIGGVEVDKFHYEVRDARVSADGTVRVGMQSLKPASEKDLENYKRGLGGRFKDFVSEDKKTKEKNTYDVFVIPDNRRGGFARAFSQKVSQELFERREEKAKATRKQDFSLGF